MPHEILGKEAVEKSEKFLGPELAKRVHAEIAATDKAIVERNEKHIGVVLKNLGTPFEGETGTQLADLRGRLVESIPRLRSVLLPLPDVPLLPPGADEGMQKAHKQLVALHSRLLPVHHHAAYCFGLTPDPGWLRAPENELECKAMIAESELLLSAPEGRDYPKIRAEYITLRGAMEKERTPAVTEAMLKLMGLDRGPDGRPLLTAVQFRYLLNDLETTAPQMPGTPGHPIGPPRNPADAKRLAPALLTWTQLFGSPENVVDILTVQLGRPPDKAEVDKMIKEFPAWNIRNIRLSLRDIRRLAEGVPAEGADEKERKEKIESAVRGCRDQIVNFLIRRREYEELIRRPDAPPPAAFGTQFSIMMAMLAARGPLDPHLPGIFRPLHAPEAFELSKPQYENVLKTQERLRANLVARGYSEAAARRIVPSLPELNRILNEPNYRNIFRDLVHHNLLDGVLLVLYLHSSPNKVQGFASWMSVMGVNAAVNLPAALLERWLIRLAVLSPRCARLAQALSRIPGNPWLKAAIAITILIKGHEWFERRSEDIDRFLFGTLSLPGRDQLTFILGGLGDVTLGLLERAALGTGLSRIDPERDFFNYIGGETVGVSFSGEDSVLNRGLFRTLGDWNDRVTQAMDGQPPMSRRLWELELVRDEALPSGASVTPDTWARRRAVDLVRNVQTALQGERRLNQVLDELGLLPEGARMDFVSIAIDDDASERRNDEALHRAAVIDGPFTTVGRRLQDDEKGVTELLKKAEAERKTKRDAEEAAAKKEGREPAPAPEPLPTAAELSIMFRNYRLTVETLARQVAVYRHLGLYSKNEWLGANWAAMGDPNGNYDMTEFTRSGVIVEIAHLALRREIVTFGPGSPAPVDFAGDLADCLGHPRYGVFAPPTKPRVEEHLRHDQQRADIRRLASLIGEYYSEAHRDEEQAVRFNEALEPLRSLVLRYHRYPAPPEELAACIKALDATLAALAKTEAPYVIHSPRSLLELPITSRLRIRGVGPWTNLHARAPFTRSLAKAVAENPDLEGKYLVFFNTSHAGGSTVAALHVVYCTTSDPATWEVRVHYAAGHGGRMTTGTHVAPRLDTDIITYSSDMPRTFAQWSKRFPDVAKLAARDLDEITKERVAAERKEEEEKVRVAKEEKAEKEAIEKAAFPLVMRSETLRGLFTPGAPVSNGTEYRVGYGDGAVVSVYNNEGDYYFDPRAGARVELIPGSDEHFVRSFTVTSPFNRSFNPSPRDTVLFRFLGPDGAETRRISINSYAAFTLLNDADKATFLELLCTPTTNNYHSLARIVRLFNYELTHYSPIFGDPHSFVARVHLIERLQPLYVNCMNKGRFLRTLWDQLVERCGARNHISEDVVNELVAWFRQPAQRKSLGIVSPCMGCLGVRGSRMLRGEMRVWDVRYISADAEWGWGEGDDSRILSAADVASRTEPFNALALVERDVPAVDIPTVGFPAEAGLSGNGQRFVKMLRWRYDMRGKELQELRKTREALQNGERRQWLLKDLHRDCTWRPPALSDLHRKPFEEYSKALNDFLERVHAARRARIVIGQVLETLGPRLATLHVPTPELDYSEYGRYVVYNPAEVKLRDDLMKTSPSVDSLVYELVEEGQAASLRGQSVSGAISRILAEFDKNCADFDKRAAEYRKARDARARPTSEARDAVNTEAPRAEDYRVVIPDGVTMILGDLPHRPVLSWRKPPASYVDAAESKRDIEAFRRIIEELAGRPRDFNSFTTWENVRAVSLDVIGTGPAKRYLVTVLYRLPFRAQTGPMPEVMTLQAGAAWSEGGLAIAPFELTLEADGIPVVQAARRAFADIEAQDAASVATMSPAESLARLFGPRTTIRRVRLPDTAEECLAFRVDDVIVVFRRGAAGEWQINLLPFMVVTPVGGGGEVRAKRYAAENVSVPLLDQKTRVATGKTIIDGIQKNLASRGGTIEGGWMSLDEFIRSPKARARFRATLPADRDAAFLADVARMSRSMAGGTIENGYEPRSAGLLVAVNASLFPPGMENQIDASLTSALGRLAGNPELQAQAMEAMRKTLAARGGRPFDFHDASRLNAWLSTVGAGPVVPPPPSFDAPEAP